MSLGYCSFFLVAAVLCAWPPVSVWLLERKMTAIAHELAEFKHTEVRCESVTASIFDRTPMRWAGYAYFQTGEIVFKAGWCEQLENYLRHPTEANRRERFSFSLLTHEAMHIRNRVNELETECQAIQRNYRTLKLLGLPEAIAREHSVKYYLEEYR